MGIYLGGISFAFPCTEDYEVGLSPLEYVRAQGKGKESLGKL